LCKNKLSDNERGNVHITLTVRSIPVTTVAMKNPISITFSHCIFVASGNQYALYCHLWPAWLDNIFPHYLIKEMIFEKSY
jgi:hypothetical protein